MIAKVEIPVYLMDLTICKLEEHGDMETAKVLRDYMHNQGSNMVAWVKVYRKLAVDAGDVQRRSLSFCVNRFKELRDSPEGKIPLPEVVFQRDTAE